MTTNLYTLITGASEGFGKSLALECANRNMNLVLVALPGATLSSLAEFIKRNYSINVHCIEKDLCSDGACREVYNEVKAAGLKVNVLINNAGLGSTLLFAEGAVALYEKQIKLNVLATTLMTRFFLDELKANGPSHILNVGSMASFFCLRKKMVYGATKSFVYSFSRALRQELKKDKVYVSVLCPGGMNTNLSITLMIKNAGYFSRLAVMDPEQAAPIALNGLFANKAVIVPGRFNQGLLMLAKILPGFIKTMLMNRSVNEMQITNRFNKYATTTSATETFAQIA
jgi:uncharacterized protein